MAGMINRMRQKKVPESNTGAHDWSKSGSFINKPARGWLHPEEKLLHGGVCYGVRYVGCLEVKQSMRTLQFDVRGQVTKEAIHRVCESAGFRNVNKKRKVNKSVTKILGAAPNIQFGGANVNLTVSTNSINLMIMETGQIIANHQMQGISFASGGDPDCIDYVAYVAKDPVNGRACHVLECAGGLAQDVITTVGQAFELRFKEYLRNPPKALQTQDRFEVPIFEEEDSAWGDEPTYYNDLGKLPPVPKHAQPVPPLPSTHYQTPSSIPASNGTYASLKDQPKAKQNVQDNLYDNRGEPNLIDFEGEAAVPSGGGDPKHYDNSQSKAPAKPCSHVYEYADNKSLIKPKAHVYEYADNQLPAKPQSDVYVYADNQLAKPQSDVYEYADNQQLAKSDVYECADNKPLAKPQSDVYEYAENKPPPVWSENPQMTDSVQNDPNELNDSKQPVAIQSDSELYDNAKTQQTTASDLQLYELAACKLTCDSDDKVYDNTSKQSAKYPSPYEDASAPRGYDTPNAAKATYDVPKPPVSAFDDAIYTLPTDLHGANARQQPDAPMDTADTPSKQKESPRQPLPDNSIQQPGASTTDVFDMGEAAAASCAGAAAPEEKTLNEEAWFHGPITRKQAEILLEEDGDFLVRESTTSQGQYVLSGMQGGHSKHLLLVDPKGVVRTKDKVFESVQHLISYHRDNSVPIMSAGSAVRLNQPVLRS